MKPHLKQLIDQLIIDAENTNYDLTHRKLLLNVADAVLAEQLSLSQSVAEIRSYAEGGVGSTSLALRILRDHGLA